MNVKQGRLVNYIWKSSLALLHQVRSLKNGKLVFEPKLYIFTSPMEKLSPVDNF